MSLAGHDRREGLLAPLQLETTDISATKNMSVANTVADGLRQYFHVRGIRNDKLLRAAGLDKNYRTQKLQYERFPIQKLALTLEMAAEAEDDPDFGLHFGEWYRPGTLHPCNFAISYAPNLRSALISLCVHRTQLANIPTRLDEHAPMGALEWHLDTGQGLFRQVEDFKFVRSLQHVRDMLGQDWKPAGASLTYSRPADDRELIRLLGENILYDAPCNQFLIHLEDLDKTNTNSDSDIYFMATQCFQASESDWHPDTSMIDRLKKFIGRSLEYKNATLGEASMHVGMSPSRLRRMLKRHKTCFQCLVDDCRQSHAKHYIDHTTLSFAEIAYRIGFSDQTVLTRACRRWFSQTPREMRRQTTEPG